MEKIPDSQSTGSNTSLSQNLPSWANNLQTTLKDNGEISDLEKCIALMPKKLTNEHIAIIVQVVRKTALEAAKNNGDSDVFVDCINLLNEIDQSFFDRIFEKNFPQNEYDMLCGFLLKNDDDQNSYSDDQIQNDVILTKQDSNNEDSNNDSVSEDDYRNQNYGNSNFIDSRVGYGYRSYSDLEIKKSIDDNYETKISNDQIKNSNTPEIVRGTKYYDGPCNIKLFMEQGVWGPLKQGPNGLGPTAKITLYSGQFSSCSPIIMFNEKTGVGGLFHFPGGGLSDPDVVNNLKNMCNDIQPTEIHIYIGTKEQVQAKSEREYEGLKSLFDEIKPNECQIVRPQREQKPNSVSVCTDDDGKLKIGGPISKFNLVLRNPESLENLPNGFSQNGAKLIDPMWS